MVTGEITRTASDKATAAVYTNVDSSGFYSLSGNAGGVDQWMDWGVIPGSGLVSQSGVVDSFTWGYATNATDTTLGGPGAAHTLVFHEGATGFGNPGIEIANFIFSGLPGDDPSVAGASGWIVGVSLVGGFEFCIADGAFGFSWIFDDAVTGPLLVWVGLPGVADDPDGNGDYAAFDWYAPPPSGSTSYLGTFFFRGAGAYDFSSWWLNLNEEDGSCGTASATFRNGGTNAANLVSTAPIYGGAATVTVSPKAGGTFSFIVGYTGGPFSFTTAFGTILCNILDPNGELLGQGPMVNAGIPAVWILPTPKDLTLCGVGLCIQSIQFGGGVSLTNAYDDVVGF